MNTRWKSLFLAIFSACLLAGSVNARVCFLADGKCNDMQLRPIAVGEDCEFNKNDRLCRLPKRAGGESCIRNGTVYYEKCVCPESYKYEVDASDEVYDYTSGGNIPAMHQKCDGKTKYKVCKDDYKYVVEDADNVNNHFESLGSNIYHPVENCSGGSSVDEDSDSCEEIGLGITRYSGCLCNYPYTEEDIKGYEGLVSLGGNTCVVDGVIHYETLTCTDGSRDGFYYKSDCADNEELSINHSLRDINGNIICYACKAPKTCEEMSMFKDETSCKQSGSHIKCVEDTVSKCYKVEGCETTSLGYQQTLVDHYNCYDNKLGCAAGDPNCYKECACIKGGVDENPQDCNVVYNNQGTATQPICELDCTSLGYKQCDRRQHWQAADAYDYCIGDITKDNANKSDNYYRECERKNQCFPLFEDDVRYYWDGSGVGYCEMVLEIEEDDKWTTDGNPSPDGYWKGKTYSDDKAEYWLNNGYYHADRCVPLKGTDDVDETNRHLRLHHCESEDADCAGNYSSPYGTLYDFPGWKTANEKNDCLNPAPTEYNDEYSEEKDENGLLLHDGIRVECGGKGYITDCKCTTYGKKAIKSDCHLLPIPISDIKEGDYFGEVKYANGGTQAGKHGVIYTGELEEGCVGFKKQYGWFTAAGSASRSEPKKKCLSEDIVYGESYVCLGDQLCVGNILAKERDSKGNFIENGRKICDGTCVQTQTCTEDQACETAVTIGDEKYCTKCVTAYKCASNEEKCTSQAIDAITGEAYCTDNSTCKNVCKIYAENLADAGKTNFGYYYDNNENCRVMPKGSSFSNWYKKEITITIDDDYYKCNLIHVCNRAIDENSPCTELTDFKPIPTFLDSNENGKQDEGEPKIDYCSSRVYQKSAEFHENCGSYVWSEKCCAGGDHSVTVYGDKDKFLEALEETSDTYTYEDVTAEYHDLYTTEPEKFDEQIGCYYVRKKNKNYSTCKEYSDYYGYTGGCKIYHNNHKDEIEGYDYRGSSTVFSDMEGYCYVYYKTCDSTCTDSKIYGLKTAEEVCPNGKVPSGDGTECSGTVYYSEGTKCECENRQQGGLYLDKAGNDSFYLVADQSVGECQYYARCDQHPYKPKDGWKENPCQDGLLPATDAEKETVCGTTYYAPNTECVCPEQTGCFVTTDTSSVNWDKNYEVSKSNGCTYYAACNSKTTDCEGKYSPTYGRTMYTEQECIDSGTEPEGDVVVPAGVCGGPYYAGCKSVKQ